MAKKLHYYYYYYIHRNNLNNHWTNTDVKKGLNGLLVVSHIKWNSMKAPHKQTNKFSEFQYYATLIALQMKKSFVLDLSQQRKAE